MVDYSPPPLQLKWTRTSAPVRGFQAGRTG